MTTILKHLPVGQRIGIRKISFISLIHFRDEYMSPQNNHLQRPPAAVLYADELAKLKQNDNAPCPPGWQLSLPAARAFILHPFKTSSITGCVSDSMLNISMTQIILK